METEGRAPMSGSIFEPLFSVGAGTNVTAKSEERREVAQAPRYTKYPRFGKRGAPQAFPSKLYEILKEESSDIVGWTESGKGFEVRNHERFCGEILGKYFKQDKFSSFQRQLNLYGFRKVTKGSESGSYSHPSFRRGDTDNLMNIRRSTKTTPAPRPQGGQTVQSPQKPPVKPTAGTGTRGRMLPSPLAPATWGEAGGMKEVKEGGDPKLNVAPLAHPAVEASRGKRRRGEEGGGKRDVDLNERETEVVGLLQCMAQNAKDSPDEESPPLNVGVAETSRSYGQWYGQGGPMYGVGEAALSMYTPHGDPYPRGHGLPHHPWGLGRISYQDFVERLYDILNQECNPAISWTHSGMGFFIQDPAQLVREVLPRFFHRDELWDFWAVLEECGFRQHYEGPEVGSYFHENFVRDRPELLCYVAEGGGMCDRSPVPPPPPHLTPRSESHGRPIPCRLPVHAPPVMRWPPGLKRSGFMGNMPVHLGTRGGMGVGLGYGMGQGHRLGLGARPGPGSGQEHGPEHEVEVDGRDEDKVKAQPSASSSGPHRASTTGRHPGFNLAAVHLHGGRPGLALEPRQAGVGSYPGYDYPTAALTHGQPGAPHSYGRGPGDFHHPELSDSGPGRFFAGPAWMQERRRFGGVGEGGGGFGSCRGEGRGVRGAEVEIEGRSAEKWGGWRV